MDRPISEMSDAELLELAATYDLSEILDDFELKEALRRIGHTIEPIVSEQDPVEIDPDRVS